MQSTEDKNIKHYENFWMIMEKTGIFEDEWKRSEDIHGLRAYGLLYRIRLHGAET